MSQKMSCRPQMESSATDRVLWILQLYWVIRQSANADPKLVLISLRLPRRISQNDSRFSGAKINKLVLLNSLFLKTAT